MALRPDELAKTIDLTLPDPKATGADVERLCGDARELHFASVCVFPEHIRQAAALLRACDVKLCGVVGFPLGAEDAKAKVTTAERCLADGAEQLEVVMNISAMLSGDFRLVRDELAALARVLHMVGVNLGRQIILKAIVESSRLDDKRKRLACKIVEDAGADFAQTSSGFGSDSAMVRDVEVLRECLSENVGVKASGWIRTAEDVDALVTAGAARVGTPAAVGIMQSLSTRESV